ncbi:MAG: hypothetical protein HZB65_00400 [Candidatus Aenigmarchaeota archaeon]|nr:hypothetical protein [Candidatus Aenigmarchaeota archaeon]
MADIVFKKVSYSYSGRAWPNAMLSGSASCMTEIITNFLRKHNRKIVSAAIETAGTALLFMNLASKVATLFALSLITFDVPIFHTIANSA